jgi:hypothetical protein
MTITPRHPQTRCALAQAQRLANLFCPVTEAQHVAHQRLVDAIRSGNLYRVIDTMRAARTIGRRGLSTLDWSEWSGAWIDKVQAIILSDADRERAA